MLLVGVPVETHLTNYDIMDNMTEEYKGEMCCAGCTCTNAHSSVPPVDTEE